MNEKDDALLTELIEEQAEEIAKFGKNTTRTGVKICLAVITCVALPLGYRFVIKPVAGWVKKRRKGVIEGDFEPVEDEKEEDSLE